MSSLGEKIALLTNPTPQVLDPEDAINFDTSEKLPSLNIDYNNVDEVSDLRRKTAPLLEDVDPAYAGRKVSRKDLGALYNESSKSKVADGTESDDSLSDEEISDEDEVDISDSDVMNFRKLVLNSNQSEDVDEHHDSEEESESDVEVDSNEKVSDEETDNSYADGDNRDNDENTSDKISEQFSNIDVSNEIERGEAVKNQLELWNRLMEARIKLQKLLIIANKLPQAQLWKKLKCKGGMDFKENSKKASRSVQNLLRSFLDLQSNLVDTTPEIEKLANIENGLSKKDGDEEIPSDTDEEEPQNTPVDTKVKKRKKDKDFEEILAKRFKSLIPYRNSVIQKWDEKTKLSAGRMTQKSFNAFDNSALKQIDQILQDKNRLIRRTQLKRSLYRVLGKPVEEETVSDSEDKSKSKQDMLLKDYDPDAYTL